MKQFTWLALLIAAGLSPPAARGDQINWGYDWMAFPGQVPAGKSKVVFTDEPYQTAAGNKRVVATILSSILTDPAAPDAIGNTGGYYALVMGVQDLASGQWGALFFQGQLQGSVVPSGNGLTNRIIGPRTKSLDIEDTRFIVTLDEFLSANGVDQQSILASVEVAAIRRETPEPSALLLAGVGMAAAGAVGWRRQRAVARG